ncbi:PEP-CTERM sorting domain-containing protein [Haloferula sp.]|uniref:PEP-CTERM sorting domain-containing protein n=1 Tax=Haloferula sp. TaxID=2497595 RepID=UPI003C78156E
MKLTFLTSCSAVCLAVTAHSAIVINEIFADDAFGDDAEFVELFGLPGESLSGLSFIVVDGDTGGSTDSSSYRRVNEQYDFTTEVMPSDGFFVIGFGLAPGVADLVETSSFLQNGSQTYALVPTADISYDLVDTDELTQASVDAITASLIDAVGNIDAADDDIYFGATDISDGSGFAIDTASRIPNGVDTDSAGDWLTQSTFEPPLELGDSIATPGATNVPEPSVMILSALGILGFLGCRRR